MFGFASPLSNPWTYQTITSNNNFENGISSSWGNSKGSCLISFPFGSFNVMRSLYDESLSFPLSPTLDIKSLDNILFSYHAMGLARDFFHKSLLLVCMYTRSSARFYVNQFCTLPWTNEYKFQFHSQDDAKHIYAKMQRAMGANVHPPTPIKSHHSCGSNFRPFTRWV